MFIFKKATYKSLNITLSYVTLAAQKLGYFGIVLFLDCLCFPPKTHLTQWRIQGSGEQEACALPQTLDVGYCYTVRVLAAVHP